MPFNSKPFWWVECDGCGERIDYGDFEAWVDQDQAASEAEARDWTRDGDRWHCHKCPPLDVEGDCRCPAGDTCPCEADGGEDGLCACCRSGEHNGACAAPGAPIEASRD